ncbi:MAG: large subunit ribosomal protein L25, partial [Chlamydiales bacterium]
MKLNIKKRAAASKGETNIMRRNGNIPSIVYAEGKPGDNIEVIGAEFAAISRAMKPGHLPTTIFTLKNEEGKEYQAIVKGIDYHPTTYNILHLDFVKLIDDVKVNVKVP